MAGWDGLRKKRLWPVSNVYYFGPVIHCLRKPLKASGSPISIKLPKSLAFELFLSEEDKCGGVFQGNRMAFCVILHSSVILVLIFCGYK